MHCLAVPKRMVCDLACKQIRMLLACKRYIFINDILDSCPRKLPACPVGKNQSIRLDAAIPFYIFLCDRRNPGIYRHDPAFIPFPVKLHMVNASEPEACGLQVYEFLNACPCFVENQHDCQITQPLLVCLIRNRKKDLHFLKAHIINRWRRCFFERDSKHSCTLLKSGGLPVLDVPEKSMYCSKPLVSCRGADSPFLFKPAQKFFHIFRCKIRKPEFFRQDVFFFFSLFGKVFPMYKF